MPQFVDAACVIALEAFLPGARGAGRGREGREDAVPSPDEVATTIHTLITHVEVKRSGGEGAGGGAAAAPARADEQPEPALLSRAASVSGRRSMSSRHGGSREQSDSDPDDGARSVGGASAGGGGGGIRAAITAASRGRRRASASPGRGVGFREARRERLLRTTAPRGGVRSPEAGPRSRVASAAPLLRGSRTMAGMASPASLPRSPSGPLSTAQLAAPEADAGGAPTRGVVPMASREPPAEFSAAVGARGVTAAPPTVVVAARAVADDSATVAPLVVTSGGGEAAALHAQTPSDPMPARRAAAESAAAATAVHARERLRRAWDAPVHTDDPWYALAARYCVGIGSVGGTGVDAPAPSSLACTLGAFMRLARDLRLPCNAVNYGVILRRCAAHAFWGPSIKFRA